MPAEPTRDNLDVERLSSYLKALANPARLELLWLLRIPMAPSEILLAPRRRDGALQATRPMSRQSVEEHLTSLEELGVVERLEDEEGKGATTRVLNQARLFAIVEELRALTAIRPSVRVDVDATLASVEEPALAWEAGAKLVLVNGPFEGRTHPLSGAGPWMVGRSRAHAVSLAYDPYASADHARLVAVDGGYAIESASQARNACRVNFSPLRAGETRRLRSGDVVGVGRSLLVYQES